MKELLSIKEKAHRYDKALRVVEKLHSSWKETQNRAADEIEEAFPELGESEDDRIRKEIIQFLQLPHPQFVGKRNHEEWIAWLEKQGSNLVENGYTNNKDVIKYADNYSHAIWHKLMDNFKNIKDYYIGCNDVSDIVLNAIIDAYNWFEKQGEEKPIKEHNICTFCEDKYGCVSPCPTKLIEEQKPADKFEPKFKVGDKIIRKEFGGDFIHNPHKIIQVDILDKKYRLEGGLDAHFLEEDDWELVEQEPKFNVGDWLVCCNYEPEQIIGIRNDMYEMSNGDIRPIKMITNNHNIRLWTIKDAKDGDVLANNGNIILFKEISNSARKDYKYIKSYCLVLAHSLDFYTGGSYNLDDGFHPTTQEQRDLLFTKMKEAGYEWDAEKKVLRKIEQQPTDNVEPKFKVGDWVINSEGTLRHIVAVDKTGYETDKGWLTHDDYEKSFHLWSIQDAKDGDVLCIHSSESDCIFLYQNTVEIESGRNVAVAYCGIDVYVDRIDFGIQGPDCIDVRKIKPAAKEQRDLLFTKMKEAGYKWNINNKELRKIEQKPIWSEADDEILHEISQCVYDNVVNIGTVNKVRYIDWLKSLKEKCTWKPSDEQMKLLKEACDKHWEPDGLDPLYTLYQDLKELKRE